MIADVIVTVNDEIVEGRNKSYGLKALIGTLFSFSEKAMQEQLFASGFVKDEAGKMDAVTNSGFVKRKAWTNGGAVWKFMESCL